MATLTDKNWQIESLFKNAFARTKDRFLSYFITAVIMWIGFGAVFIIGALIGGGMAFVAYTSHNPALYGGIALIVFALVVALFYFISWGSLTIIQVMIDKDKIESIKAFQKVRPLVWGYAGMQAIYFLFILGLSPFVILSLGLIAMLWVIWTIFIGFAYLEKGKRGMEAVWYSRSVVNQNFWPIVGRVALITAVLIAVQGIFGFNHNSSLRIISTIISIVSTPFIISFYYEMFKNLNQDITPVKPTGWIIASVAGGIIGLALLVLLSTAAVSYLPGLLQDMSAPNKRPSPNQFKYNNKMLPPPSIPDKNNGQNSYQL